MKEFKCDCGFKWIAGNSGHHQCGPFYMEKVDGLKQELGESKAHIAYLRNAIAGPAAYLRANKLSTIGTDSIYHQIMNEALEAVPVQSLNDIRASAVMGIMDTDYSCETSTGESAWGEGAIEAYADKLKEGTQIT